MGLERDWDRCECQLTSGATNRECNASLAHIKQTLASVRTHAVQFQDQKTSNGTMSWRGNFFFLRGSFYRLLGNKLMPARDGAEERRHLRTKSIAIKINMEESSKSCEISIMHVGCCNA